MKQNAILLIKNRNKDEYNRFEVSGSVEWRSKRELVMWLWPLCKTAVMNILYVECPHREELLYPVFYHFSSQCFGLIVCSTFTQQQRIWAGK